ncbi:MAG TPA: DoxX family protein [Methylomirabilota bacterium]|jgi:putative oxidoreductase|nr:DoxX family protein [Methylomirabilota bacterium]
MNDRRAWGLALLRIMLGIIFVMHGYYAAAVLGLERTRDLMTRIGNPEELSGLLTWYLFGAHFLGGLALIIGFWTTVAALAQVPIMAAAVFLLHWPQGFFMHAVMDGTSGRAAVGGYEFALLVLVTTVAIVFTGPGAWSVDGAYRHPHDLP